jgi:hypothetical protein
MLGGSLVTMAWRVLRLRMKTLKMTYEQNDAATAGFLCHLNVAARVSRVTFQEVFTRSMT